MKLNKRFMKIDILSLLVLIWSLIFFILMITKENDVLSTINSYLFVFISLFVAGYTLGKAIKTHDKDTLLYSALGFSCLAIGNIYFVLLNFVNSIPDTISVGDFSQICCYLFFLSALINLKKDNVNKLKVFFAFITTISVIATIACAYAVISNTLLVIIIAEIILDALCMIAAVLAFSNKKAKNFAILMFIVSLLDIIAIINPPYLIGLFLSASSAFLYLLIARSLIGLKVGDKHA